MKYTELSAKIKEQYPDYETWDDYELAQAVVAKYPQYQDTDFSRGPVEEGDTNTTDMEEVVGLFDQLKTNEGYRDSMYLDTKGVPTIGYGFNLKEQFIQDELTKQGYDVNELMSGSAISQEHADAILSNVVGIAEADARKFLPNFDDQPKEVQNILTDMSYNMGYPALSGFTNFRQALLDNDYIKASEEMVDSVWYGETGQRAKRLADAMAGVPKVLERVPKLDIVINPQTPKPKPESPLASKEKIRKAMQDVGLFMSDEEGNSLVDINGTAIALHYQAMDGVDYEPDSEMLKQRLKSDVGTDDTAQGMDRLTQVYSPNSLVTQDDLILSILDGDQVPLEYDVEGYQRRSGWVDTFKSLGASFETALQAVAGTMYDLAPRQEIEGWDELSPTKQAMLQMYLGGSMPSPGVPISAPTSGEEVFEARQDIVGGIEFIPEEWDESIRKVYADTADEDIPFVELGFKVLASQGATISAGMNPVTGVPVMISLERESMLDELMAGGIPYEDAQNWSSLYGSLSGSIEYIENAGKLTGALLKKPKEWTKKKAWKMIGNTLKHAGINVGEELTQAELFTLIYNQAVLDYNEKNPNNPIELKKHFEDMGRTTKTSLAMSLALDSIGYSRMGIRTANDVRKVKKKKKQLIDRLGLPEDSRRSAEAALSRVTTPEELGVWFNDVIASMDDGPIEIGALIPNTEGYSMLDLVNAYIANDPNQALLRIRSAVANGGDSIDILMGELAQFEQDRLDNEEGFSYDRDRSEIYPEVAQAVNLMYAQTEDTPVTLTLDNTVATLLRPLTSGQFQALGDSRPELMMALDMLDSESAAVLANAVQGDEQAQQRWNEIAHTIKLQEKIQTEGIDSLTDEEKKLVIDTTVKSYEHKTQKDKDKVAVEKEAAEKDKSLDPNKGMGFVTRLMSWTNPLKAIARVAPNFANRISRYESLRNHYYNEYLRPDDGVEGIGGNPLKQLQALIKIDKMMRRMFRDSPKIKEALEDYYNSDILEFFNGHTDWDSVLMSLGFLHLAYQEVLTGEQTMADPNLVEGIKDIQDKPYFKAMVKELESLNFDHFKLKNIWAIGDAHWQASRDIGGSTNHDKVVPIIKHDSKNSFLRGKLGDDRAAIDNIVQGKRTDRLLKDKDGNEIQITADDLQYLDSPFEAMLRTIKRAADLKAAKDILDSTGITVRFSQDGMPIIDDISNEALRSFEELASLNDKTFGWIAKTFQDVMGKPVPGGGFVRGWKGVVTPLVSQWTTAFKQLGDLPKAFYSTSRIVGWKKTFQIAHDILRNKVHTKLLNDSTYDIMSGWFLDNIEVDLNPRAIGADVVDLDLEVDDISDSFREYAKAVWDDLKMAGMESETGVGRGWERLKRYWTRSSLLLMKYMDITMKDMYLEASVRGLQSLDETQRIEKLTMMLRGNTELAVQVSSALVDKNLDESTRLALYNIMNRLHPLSAFDRAPAFRKLPILGIFQSFQTMQTAIGQDMVLTPLSNARKYGKVGLEYHAKALVLEKRVADLKAKLAELQGKDQTPEVIGEIEAVKENLSNAQSELSSAKKRRRYATEESLSEIGNMIKSAAEFVTFYLVGDVLVGHLIRQIERLLGEEEKPWEEDMETTLWESMLDTAMPLINLSVLLDERKRTNPIEAVISDVTDMPLPVPNTTRKIAQLVTEGEIEDARNMLKDIPLFGRALYDVQLGIETHLLPEIYDVVGEFKYGPREDTEEEQ